MPTMHQLIDLPTLDRAIAHPVTVTPNTAVLDAIALMSQVGGSCALPNLSLLPDRSLERTSCLLVVDKLQLVGVFTQRDVVRLTATGMELSGVKVAEVMRRQVITLTPSPFDNIFTVLTLMRQYQLSHLPIVDEQGRLVGIVTPASIRQVLQPANLLKLRQVADVMSTDTIHAFGSASLLSIAQLMANHCVSCVVIVEEAGNQAENTNYQIPIGIITERDIVQFQALELNLARTQAQTVMSQPLFCLNPANSLWYAHEEMQRRHLRRLVVAGDLGELKGIITQASLLQVFDPVEMAAAIEVLQQQLQQRSQELEQVNLQLQKAQNRQALNELETQGETQRTICELTSDFIYSCCVTPTKAIVDKWVTSNLARLTGYTFEDLPKGENAWLNLVYPKDLPSVYQIINELIANNQPRTLEYRIVTKQGEIRWVCDRIQPKWDDKQQRVVQLIGAVEDISERKQAEQKIAEQAALLNVATDAIFVCGLDNQILFWNQSAECLYGWQAAEALGKNATQLLYQESPELAAALKSVFELSSWQGELHKVGKCGKKIIVESRWTLVRDDDGKPKSILIVDTDITQKKQLEAQFHRTQRLENLGTLASGIAHDLNNILTPILAVAEILQYSLSDTDDRQEMLKILETNATRGADLVKQVLSFAKGTEGKRTTVQIRHLLKDIQQIALRTFPKSIEAIADIPPDLCTVTGDFTQLHQVLMNLVVNARDAMPDGGILSISASNFFVDENYARMHLQAKVGAYVIITVADTGMGISPEILERVFEPFFTTKEVGRGTGLGLSTVLGIVKSHGGFIDISSQAGKGSRFQVYLPASEGCVYQAAEKLELPSGNGELILVVDDEAAICETTKSTLSSQNYRVIIAHDGIEAIALYAQHKREISLVLIDLIMPSMDSSTAILAMQRMNPQVQIVAMSGMTTTQALSSAARTNIQAFLPKPFTTWELLSTFNRVLNQK